MNKVLICIAFLAICFGVSAQTEDENVIAGQYIVQFYGDVNAEFWFEACAFPHDVSDHQCLSKSMNIWLVTSIDFNLLPYFVENKYVKVAQYNHGNIKQRSLVPNDSLFNIQWNMLNTSTPGADISATQAWQVNHSNVTRTGDSIVIAVIDGGLGSGFDIYHPDINFFVNKNEIPNNGIDDDHNGYIDDYHGWNVYTNSDSVYNTSSQHATHVSGIAAAIGNNSHGVAGVCWGAKVLAINGSSNNESDVIKAYDYVLEMRKLYDLTSGAKGAFIVATNSSFGVGNYGANPVNYPIWCALYDSMGHYGILSSIAPPDAGVNVDQVNDVPTGCASKWMIAVTNTTRTDGLNTQAGFGQTTVDIGAPGTSIMSCYPNASYGYDAGTSMSCPHMTGAVAAMYANACPRLMQDYFAYPDSIALVMKDYLLQSGDPISALHNITLTGKRLNLYHALLTEAAYNCNNCNYSASLHSSGLICYGDSIGSVTVSVGITNAHYHYLWSRGDTTSSISGLAAGFYQVTVTDTSGCQRELSTVIAQPTPISISTINVIPVSSSPGNIIVGASAGNDTLVYAMDTGSYQTSAIFVTTVTGAHTIHLRTQNGCVMDTVVYIYYTGVGDAAASMPIRVYPNPSTGMFYISGVESGVPTEVRVTDVLGNIILTKSLVQAYDKTLLPVENLANGIYQCSIMQEGKTIMNTKIVVTH